MANDTNTKTETKSTPTTQPATLATLRKASNAIVDALETLPREDQLRALEAATSLLGLRRKPNQQQPQGQQGRGGRQ